MTARMIPARAAELVAAVLALTAVVLATTAGVAGAIPATRGSASSAGAAKAKGERPTKEAYEFNYTEMRFYGPVHCVGKHETNASKGWPGTPAPDPARTGTGGRDVEKCTSTTGLPLVGMLPGEHKVGPPIEGEPLWGSDWDGNAITTSNFEYTVSHNGKSFKIVAIYPYA